MIGSHASNTKDSPDPRFGDTLVKHEEEWLKACTNYLPGQECNYFILTFGGRMELTYSKKVLPTLKDWNGIEKGSKLLMTFGIVEVRILSHGETRKQGSNSYRPMRLDGGN